MTEDSSTAGSSKGSGTARELELGGAGYIDESVSADGKSNCMLDGRLGGAEYIEESVSAGGGSATEDSSTAGSEYIVTSMTAPSEVATSVGKEKIL